MSEDYSKYAMLAYPVKWPTDKTPPRIDDLHSTVIFLGEVVDLPAPEDIAWALESVDTNVLQYVEPEGFAAFGPNEDIPVLKLKGTEIMQAIYEQAAEALENIEVRSASEYGYNPHVTVDLQTALWTPPSFVFLDTLCLWYGGVSQRVGTAGRRFNT